MSKKFLILILFGLLAAFSFYKMRENLKTMDLMMQEVRIEIAETNNMLKELKNEKSDNTDEQDLAAIYKVGQEVATLQNDYKELVTISINQDDVSRFEANLTKLEKYFMDDFKDARLMWYMPDLNKIGDFVWSFSRPYDVSNEGGKVLWIAKDKLGSIVAYTTAKFDVKEAKFKDVVTKMTTVGGSYIGFTDTGKRVNEVDVKEIDNMIDQINALGTSENPYSEETLQGVIETRMLYKEYYDRELKEKEEKERLEKEKEKEGNAQ